MKGQIHWDSKRQKYSLLYNGKTLVSSKNADYLNYLVVKQKHPTVIAVGVTEVEVVSTKPSTGIQITNPTGAPAVMPTFDINERFEFMEQLITMVMNKSVKSLVISGEGGVGKTFTVIDTLRRAGKVDYNSVVPTIEDLTIVPDDSEEEIEDKIYSQINQNLGDYVVIKGHSTPKALYRILYEHSERNIIFDDCDSVLKDGSAIDLLKAALDSYDERWVSWRSEASAISDLPPCFKFKGTIIFISNLPLHKIDEAVRTRCFKVDLSMTRLQRIARMRTVLEFVLPHVELELKTEALDFLEAHLDVTDDINFRTLMTLITIRADSSIANWKKLALYALTEQ